MAKRKEWFTYKKNKFDVKTANLKGCSVLIFALVLLIWVGMYVLDGEDSLRKALLGFLSIGMIITGLYIVIDKKGKKID
jgi:hypothetical protein